MPPHAPDHPDDEALIPLPTLSQDDPRLFKAASNVVVAHSQPLNSPEDLAHKTTAQNGS